MSNFDRKIDTFMEYFIEYDGYKTVIEGLKNTLLIAVLGLIIGIFIGANIGLLTFSLLFSKKRKV